jgi:hypothetical protein
LKKAILTLLALSFGGCGTSFDPSSDIQSLRVLGIQKDQPYARPGTAVNLSMLWFDGKAPDGNRPIQRFWSPACGNPAGDLYYTCIGKLLGALLAAEGGGLGGGTVPAGSAGAPGTMPTSLPAEWPLPSMGDQTTVLIDSDIISARPTPPAGQHPYGLTYVFFGVCAGQMYVKTDLEQGFPVVCKDARGNYLGADDFVFGYTSIYSYNDIFNANPVVNGTLLDGKPLATAEDGVCFGAACTLPQIHPTEDDGQAMPHISACADDGGSKCPAHRIDVGIPDSCTVTNGGQTTVVPHCAEQDALSLLQGNSLQEQIWVRYYAERGRLENAVRLLNDARRGWIPDHAAKLRAPKQPGPMFVWAVVQDNRGGEAWVRQTIFVE